MTIHPLVAQLHFTRSEFLRSIEGVSEEDAVRRIMPMNCISWYVGHLANQEQFFWVLFGQQKIVVPGLNDLVGYKQTCQHTAAERDAGRLANRHSLRRRRVPLHTHLRAFG